MMNDIYFFLLFLLAWWLSLIEDGGFFSYCLFMAIAWTMYLCFLSIMFGSFRCLERSLWKYFPPRTEDGKNDEDKGDP
tara:strand:- start:1392 stop:1625 length:234 start_codon:yes stop_codon:yes gene_type:complete